MVKIKPAPPPLNGKDLQNNGQTGFKIIFKRQKKHAYSARFSYPIPLIAKTLPTSLLSYLLGPRTSSWTLARAAVKKYPQTKTYMGSRVGRRSRTMSPLLGSPLVIARFPIYVQARETRTCGVEGRRSQRAQPAVTPHMAGWYDPIWDLEQNF